MNVGKNNVFQDMVEKFEEKKAIKGVGQTKPESKEEEFNYWPWVIGIGGMIALGFFSGSFSSTK